MECLRSLTVIHKIEHSRLRGMLCSACCTPISEPLSRSTEPGDTYYLVTIPLLKALMIIEVRMSSILNGGPELSQSLTGRRSGAAHRFKPVRLLCRVKLRIHARMTSPPTAQPKVAQASHFITRISQTQSHSDMLSGDEPYILAIAGRSGF